MTRFPLLCPTLGFVLGVTFGDHFPISWSLLLGGGGLVVAATAMAAWTIRGRIPWLGLYGFLGCFVCGWIRITLATEIPSNLDLRAQVLSPPLLLRLRGRLSETPVQRKTLRAGRPQTSVTALVDVDSIDVDGHGWKVATGRIQVSLNAALPGEFYGGRRVELNGVLDRPPIAVAPGCFDYREYLRHQGIAFQLRTASLADWRLLDGLDGFVPPRPWTDGFMQWGCRVLSIGFPEEDETIHLIWAMALGWRPGMGADEREPFVESGTIHVFAISGLHVALIAGMLLEGCRFILLPRGVAAAVAIPLVWAYTAVTGWQASAIRSAIMMSIIAFGWIVDRPSHLINSLFGAAVATLIWDPQQLFLPGFQLSFVVVGSIAVLAPRIQSWDVEHYLLDPWIPKSSRSPKAVRVATVARWLLNLISVSLAAWLGALPIVAYYFNLVNPVSLLANLCVVPLSSLALISCVASLSVGGFWSMGSELFNHSAWVLMKAMVAASSVAARCEFGWFAVRSPGFAVFVGYYGGGLLWIYREAVPPRLRASCWGILGALLVFVAWQWIQYSRSCVLALVPHRGGGSCYWKEGGGWNRYGLLDPGDARFVRQVLWPFLRSQGLQRIPMLLISSAAGYQMAGMPELETRFRVQNQFFPGKGSRSPYFKDWLSRDRDSRARPQGVWNGTNVGPWDVLAPERHEEIRAAEQEALILRAQFEKTWVIWLPGMSLRAQDRWLQLQGNRDLKSKLMIAGVTTKGEFLSEAILDKIQPEFLVVVDSDYPASARLSAETKQRLRQRMANVWFLTETGYLQIQFMEGKVHLQPWSSDSTSVSSLEPRLPWLESREETSDDPRTPAKR